MIAADWGICDAVFFPGQGVSGFVDALQQF